MRVTSLFGPSAICTSKSHTTPAGITKVPGDDWIITGCVAFAPAGASTRASAARAAASQSLKVVLYKRLVVGTVPPLAEPSGLAVSHPLAPTVPRDALLHPGWIRPPDVLRR